ncbi:MAG: DNA polymerase III subunit chi [Chromatiaceae bacterium]
MTRIDFYSLKQGSTGDRFLLTCRLVERIYGEGRRVFIHVASKEEARHLDKLLWTYRQQSFLPHGLMGDTDNGLTPILIGHEGGPGEEDQVLINLTREVPDFFGRFERLAEPIDHEPAVRDAGRERYRYYRDRGYPLHHHEIQL